MGVTVKAALICLLLAGLEPEHQKRPLTQAYATLPLVMQGLLVTVDCVYTKRIDSLDLFGKSEGQSDVFAHPPSF